STESFNVGANVTTYVDGGLDENEGYFYRVRANSSNGPSGYSNTKFGGTYYPPGNALEFDGTDDLITIADNPSLDFLQQTIEGWFYFDDVSGTKYMISRSLGAVTAGDISISIQGGKFRYQIANDANTWTGVNGESATTLVASTWYHLAGTFDGTTVKVYVNGLEDASVAVTGTFTNYTTSPDPLEFGRLATAASNPFIGLMDEVRVWDEARTIGEIQSNMFNTLDGTDPVLAAYYRFDQNDGTKLTLPDRSSNNNDGLWSGSSGGTNVVPDWQLSSAMPSLPPSFLFAEETSSSSITLSWQDNSSNETGFLIERYTTSDLSGTPTDFLVNADETSYVDNTVASDVGYYYQVKAEYGGANYTDPSNTEFASTYAPPHNALAFEAAGDYVDIGDVVDFPGDFTWEAWIKPTTLSGYHDVISKHNGGNEPLLTVKSGGELTWYYGGDQSISAAGIITAGEWHHIAAVRTSGSLQLYANGVAVGSPFINSDDLTNSTSLQIGTQANSTANDFIGEIDEVRIWNNARSVSEIQSNIYNTLQGNESGLLAYYKFDQGTADADNSGVITLYDRSINQNDGILTGFTLNGTSSNWVASEAMYVAPYSVINTNDSGDGSLRQAITDANASTSKETITFNIPGAGPWLIDLQSALPTIDNASDVGMIIDATTQPGFDMDNGLMVNIDGTNAGTVDGLDIEEPNVEVYGLHISSFNQGISTTSGMDGFVIGGPNKGNVISNNSAHGLFILNTNGGLIQGNRIGTSMDGTSAPNGNGSAGMRIASTSQNIQVGGDAQAGEGNLISGNVAEGILTDGTGFIDIYGNLIGTDVTGANVLANQVGVRIGTGANDINVGSNTTGFGNVISGNVTEGIRISGSSSNVNLINNLIGTTADGENDLGNGDDGIELPNTLGTNVNITDNTISGNGGVGIQHGTNSTSGPTGLTISNNHIGVSLSGQKVVANDYQGIRFSNDGGIGNFITNNTISGNGQAAIDIAPGTSDIKIQNNRIGVFADGTATGTGDPGNSDAGIRLANADGVNNTTSAIEITGNTISGNGNEVLDENGILIFSGGSNMIIKSNLIGVLSDGITPYGNLENGISVSSSATNILIGGVGEENIIAHNGTNGIYFLS
ncbi:MAG: LamG-like jellyroll fold domain-containing protein, partial [Marinoscillum sp.]